MGSSRVSSTKASVKAVFARGHRISIGRKTKIMGILNATPDSFSGDGIFHPNKNKRESPLDKAKRLVREGADIIDIGGESTRPGAQKISSQEEIKRVIPIIRSLAKTIKKPISIDSYKKEVVEAALKAGASIVNDIMGPRINQNLLRLIKRYKAAVVLMHIRGTPRTMQKHIHYNELIPEILQELRKSVEKCLAFGIKSDKIIIDPGIGFGKTVGHNLEIIDRLSEFKTLGQPILIGPSRKSFIGKVLQKEKTDRLMGTAVSVSAAILHGADIVRVHDVKEIREAVKLTNAIQNYKYWYQQ